MKTLVVTIEWEFGRCKFSYKWPQRPSEEIFVLLFLYALAHCHIPYLLLPLTTTHYLLQHVKNGDVPELLSVLKVYFECLSSWISMFVFRETSEDTTRWSSVIVFTIWNTSMRLGVYTWHWGTLWPILTVMGGWVAPLVHIGKGVKYLLKRSLLERNCLGVSGQQRNH